MMLPLRSISTTCAPTARMMTARPAFSIVFSTGVTLAERYGVTSDERRGSISVQTISGHIRMHVEEREFDLPAGHLLALEAAVPHDVEALEDSAFVLTVAWRGEKERR
jgi:hypothetical protein